jgi:hypothetical protein
MNLSLEENTSDKERKAVADSIKLLFLGIISVRLYS